MNLASIAASNWGWWLELAVEQETTPICFVAYCAGWSLENGFRWFAQNNLLNIDLLIVWPLPTYKKIRLSLLDSKLGLNLWGPTSWTKSHRGCWPIPWWCRALQGPLCADRLWRHWSWRYVGWCTWDLIGRILVPFLSPLLCSPYNSVSCYNGPWNYNRKDAIGLKGSRFSRYFHGHRGKKHGHITFFHMLPGRTPVRAEVCSKDAPHEAARTMGGLPESSAAGCGNAETMEGNLQPYVTLYTCTNIYFSKGLNSEVRCQIFNHPGDPMPFPYGVLNQLCI